MKKLVLMLTCMLATTVLFAQNGPITSVEGESFTYTRAGKCFYPKKYGDDNYIYEGNQGGAMTVVYGANKKVYFQDPVYGFVHQTYVEGTLSEDGKTITVSVPQVLYAYESGAKVVLAVGKYEDDLKEYKIDKSVTEVTYSVEGENDDVLTLNACGDKAPLGNFWESDSTFAGRGEWETILTKYVEQTEVQEVTQEEEQRLETYDRPMGCAYWDGSANYTDVNNTIKVAKLGETDTILVQGMVSMLPDVWVRGVKKDSIVTFPVQLLKIEEGQKFFLGGISGDGLNLAPFTMFYDEKLNSYAGEDRLVVNSSDLSYNDNTVLGYYTGVYVGQRPELVQLPADITSDKIMDMPYDGVFDNGQKKQPIAGTVSVAFKGQTFYIKGLVKSVPEGWLKGTYNEFGEAKIELGQYLGHDAYGNIYAVGDKADLKGLLDFTESVDDPAAVRFTYDPEVNSFKLNNNLYASHKPQKINREYVLRSGLTINEGVAWVAERQGYDNGKEVSESNITTGVTATFAKADGSNAPKYYENDATVRMYAGNTLTITSEEKVIGKIAFVFDTKTKTPMLEAQDGDFSISDDMGIWTGDGTSVSFDVIKGSGNQARIKSIMVFFFDYSTAMVTVPDFASVMPYEMKAKVSGGWMSDDEEKTIDVKVGFKGNDVYFQGLSENVPTVWVKGKIAGNKVTIPGWSMGTYENDWGQESDLAFGESEFAYDQETGTFSTEGYKTKDPYAFSEEFADVEVFTEVTISRKPEVAAVPRLPEVTDFVGTGSDRYVAISVPAVDKDSTILFTNKLGYMLFVEKEEGKVESLTLTKDLYGFDDLAEIPYDFTDNSYVLRKRVTLLQADDELQSWKKIGIQSVYRGGDAENQTEINWYALEEYWVVTGIQVVNPEVRSVEYFDLQGRMAGSSLRGLLIKQIRLLDGSIKVVKVLRR